MPSKTTSKSASYVLGGISELPSTGSEAERNLADELFGKPDVKKIIEGIEEERGIVPRRASKPVVVKTKSIILDIDREKDRLLLESLMNDPKFNIVKWSESWSAVGRYRVFIIYQETTEKPIDKKEETK